MVSTVISIKDLKNTWEFHTETASKIPSWMNEFVFEKRTGFDLITPLQNGKEWTYEFVNKYQPLTARKLLGGSDFVFLAKQMPSREGPSFISHLAQDVNGQAIQIQRRSYGTNPDDPDYQKYIQRTTEIMTKNWGHPKSPVQRYLSLPEPIAKAYYTRFDGLQIPSTTTFGINGRILPFGSRNQWIPVDELLGYFRLKKKYLPFIESVIPDVKPEKKNLPYLNFTMFLASHGSFSSKSPLEGDYLFVKNHIQDRVVYYVRDADFENMMILENSSEAVDQYCAHVLSRKEERFDFRPWSVKL